jgi:hypothetical protein
VAYSYYEHNTQFSPWHMHILEIAFSDAYGVLAGRCGTSAAFEEKLAVLIHSEGKKRLRHGLGLRRAYDAVAVASVAVRYFSRTAARSEAGYAAPLLPSFGPGAGAMPAQRLRGASLWQ